MDSVVFSAEKEKKNIEIGLVVSSITDCASDFKLY